MRAATLTFKRARALRRALTLPEGLLWIALRRRATGLRFRRQHPFGPFVLDFYCPAAKLCVEVDGAAHDSVEALLHDRRRTAYLARHGVQVLRFAARDVLDDDLLDTVLHRIAAAARAPSTASRSPSPASGGGTSS